MKTWHYNYSLQCDKQCDKQCGKPCDKQCGKPVINNVANSVINSVANTVINNVVNRVINNVANRTTCIPHETGSAELLQANHLNNNENLPSLEVSPPISSNFQRIASTCTSAIVAYSDFTVNLYNYFLSKARLFLTKISLTTNL